MFRPLNRWFVVGALVSTVYAVPLHAQPYAPSRISSSYGPTAGLPAGDILGPGAGFGYGYGWPMGGGTAAGNYLMGRAQATQAQGQYNLDSAQATLTLEQAAALDLENRIAYVRAYFERQRLNHYYTDANRPSKATHEQLVRWAKLAAPGRPDAWQLDPSSGIILWPEALMARAFDVSRKEMERLFGERTPTNYGTTSAIYGQAQRVADDMKAELKERIHTMDAHEYLTARQMIEKLAYEVRFAPAVPGVAAK